MITEHQQDQASLYALGALPETEMPSFEAEIRANGELRELVHGLQRATDALALARAACGTAARIEGKGAGAN